MATFRNSEGVEEIPKAIIDFGIEKTKSPLVQIFEPPKVTDFISVEKVEGNRVSFDIKLPEIFYLKDVYSIHFWVSGSLQELYEEDF